ncbi:MAG: ABC transporter ATP-binding protein [Anaerolineae bacterium]
MITFQDVTYRYPEAAEPVLNALNLSVVDGEFVLVVGASGSGKSTLLRCINGLVPHFYGGTIHGSIRVDGKDPVECQPRGMSGAVGFVFQDPEAQFVVDTVESELVFAMENHDLPQATMRKRVEEVLDQLSIAHLRNRRINTLSGGEKQRVAIASVLTLEPRVLVLDEPTSQLDPQAAEEVLSALQKLNADLGLTVILSEHRLERVVQYADRVLYLPGHGHPLVDGTPQEVLAQCELAPPLIQLGKALDWQPLPFTVRDARRHAQKLAMRPETPSATPPEAVPTADQPHDIVVDNLWHAYNGHMALKGVSVRIRRGEFVAIMGRNGSGKTTLLKHLVGLLQPARGTVRVCDMDTRTASSEELVARVGYVPQNPNTLLFADTVAEEMDFTRRCHGLPTGQQDDPLLETLGIAEYAARYPRDLSVGERQRVALAAILAAQPDIILLDEPTRGVDYVQKQALVRYLETERARGRTVILSTHDVELAAASVDRVIILGDGEVVVDGTTREVMTHSMVFSSQINKLFRDDRFLTVQDVLRSLA